MTQAELAPGRRLGPYRIDALLGEGAMGRVWGAIHESIGRQVAIKALKAAAAADRSQVERFLAEARAVNLIRHENIVECEGLVHEPDGTAYVVMELLAGRTLGAAIADDGRFSPERAVQVAAQIAQALAAAHDQGIVHRDLKPENVFLIRRAGSDDYVKVLDFGIARLRPDLGAIAATETGALIGTPAYMAPEQVRGDKATPASDVYALAVVLFQMLTGRLPLTATNMPLMFVATLHEMPPRADALVDTVPAALADVIERALAKDPAARPDGMRGFARELHAALGDDAAAAQAATTTSARRSAARLTPADALAPTIAPGEATVPSRRSRAPVLLAGVAALAMLVGLLLVTRDSEAPAGAAAPFDAAVVAIASPVDAAAAPPTDAAPIDAAPAPANDPVDANARAAIKKRYLPGLNVCWEMVHKVERKLPRTAKVQVTLTVQPSGRVGDLSVDDLSYDARGLEMTEENKERVHSIALECVDRQAAMWLFPQADHAVALTMTLTLKSKH